MYKLIKFNDSKRFYQTDGLDAFIIKCPDDKLTDDCNVEIIGKNKTITYSIFKGWLDEWNKLKNNYISDNIPTVSLKKLLNVKEETTNE